MIDLNKLREIAQAATPGHKSRDYFLTILKGSSDHEQRCKDAAHIAAFNPQTALELLDYVAKLEADRQTLLEAVKYYAAKGGYPKATFAIIALQQIGEAFKSMGEL